MARRTRRRSKLALVPGGSKNVHPAREQAYEAGVYEEEIHPPGEHWVVILMPSGKVGSLKFPEELWDDDVIPNLWKQFDRKVGMLKLIE